MSALRPEPLDEAYATRLVPQRDRRGHKGTFGRVSVVAGSFDYAGAALMSGSAALRAGAGLVSLWLPASLRAVLAGRVPELITRALPEVAPGEVDAPGAAALVVADPCDALLIGPGLATSWGTTQLVLSLLGMAGPPSVVDAGAFEALAGTPGWADRRARELVLTPHPGELRRLGRDPGTSDEERLACAARAAAEWRAVVVLKGAHTVIADPGGSLRVAPFSLPLLASAGSGDILAGVIAGLLAQGLAARDAAALGVYLHARAAERLGAELGDAGLMATDLLAEIPRERRHLRDLAAAS